jgi:hypothetical protein
LEKRLNNNRLFLSLCAQLGGEVSSLVMAWFNHNLRVIYGLENQKYRVVSTSALRNNTEEGRRSLDLFKKLQLGFDDIIVREDNTSPVGESIGLYLESLKRAKIESVHRLYDKNGEICGQVNFAFDSNESSGTRKLFDISGYIFNTLEYSSILVIDELDAKMHPLISQQIIKLFNDPKTNPNNAQLIFTTHDTHLLSSKMLRRDQIWFTEKNDVEQTDLYCLTDIVLPDGSKPRNDANYEKNYIAGRYGAIPYIVND